ncbi:MAG: hypothetical protein HY548_07160 [Elusimicrobia bacterium]|nr:hypothetical protein [Elusimicrobiota bacterium]
MGKLQKPQIKKAYKEHKKAKFLKAYSEEGAIIHACEKVGLERSSITRWRKNDPKFREAFETAEIKITENLEKALYRRAVEGVESFTYDKDGNLVRTKTEYSDVGAIFLLKARDPKRFVEKLQHEHSGTIRTTFDIAISQRPDDANDGSQPSTEKPGH